MSHVSSNDNAGQPELPSLHEQVAHAIMALALHERQINRLVMCSYATGVVEPLGEVLVRLGVALKKYEDGEQAKPRIMTATNMAQATRPVPSILRGK